MEHLILLVLCCILVGITMRDQAIGLAISGGTIIFATLMFMNWLIPDVVAVLSASFNSTATYISYSWASLLR